MGNERYVRDVQRDAWGREPKFRLGQLVLSQGRLGVVDAIYANYDSAVNALAVPHGWYEIQERPLKTPKTGFFYAVTLMEAGAVMVGEDDTEKFVPPQ